MRNIFLSKESASPAPEYRGHCPIKGTTNMSHTGELDRVIFAAPFRERKGTGHIAYSIMLFTPDQIILIPVEKDPGTGKPPAQPTTQDNASRHSDVSRPASDSTSYLNREAGEILRERPDARAIPLIEIAEIEIRRVRSDSHSSRWLSILFAFYSLEPAGARYRVDYQLKIMTPDREYTLITPFSLLLKQVLVNNLGDRVHEIVDEYAPLL